MLFAPVRPVVCLEGILNLTQVAPCRLGLAVDSLNGLVAKLLDSEVALQKFNTCVELTLCHFDVWAFLLKPTVHSALPKKIFNHVHASVSIMLLALMEYIARVVIFGAA